MCSSLLGGMHVLTTRPYGTRCKTGESYKSLAKGGNLCGEVRKRVSERGGQVRDIELYVETLTRIFMSWIVIRS
jgi:hypothetical protein